MWMYSAFSSRKQHSSLTCPLCIIILFISTVPQQLVINFASWFDACVCWSTPVPSNRLFVCVGVGHALAKFSITQCCRLLEWIPSTLFMSSFYTFIFLLLIVYVFCTLTNKFFPVFCFSFLFMSPIFPFFGHCPYHTLFFPCSLTFPSASSKPSLWILGRVWLWFRNQSQASWFHVVSHFCSQCLICHIYILLQGKK